jgi:hypothetical protein
MTAIIKQLTAAQIEKGENLPPRLVKIGEEIEAKLVKADTYQGKADNMIVSVVELLKEAGKYCDGGGFNAFKKNFCPSLGKSRTYELLAITSGKKTIEQSKAENAARQAKHTAKLKTAAAVPLVTDNVVPLQPKPESADASAEKRKAENAMAAPAARQSKSVLSAASMTVGLTNITLTT